MDETILCGQCGQPLRRIALGWLDDKGHFICERGPGINHRPRKRASDGPSSPGCSRL